MVTLNSSNSVEDFILIDRKEAQQTVYILRDDQSVDSNEEIDSETVTANDSYTFSEESSVYDMTKKITTLADSLGMVEFPLLLVAPQAKPIFIIAKVISSGNYFIQARFGKDQGLLIRKI